MNVSRIVRNMVGKLECEHCGMNIPEFTSPSRCIKCGYQFIGQYAPEVRFTEVPIAEEPAADDKRPSIEHPVENESVNDDNSQSNSNEESKSESENSIEEEKEAE